MASPNDPPLFGEYRLALRREGLEEPDCKIVQLDTPPTGCAGPPSPCVGGMGSTPGARWRSLPSSARSAGEGGPPIGGGWGLHLDFSARASLPGILGRVTGPWGWSAWG